MNPFLKAAARPRFSGSIAENARRFRLVGAGYRAMPPEQNGYFDLRSARHLAGPLEALLDPEVRLVFIIGATQCLKSVVGDIWFIYLAEHTSDSVLALFEDGPKARDYATTRCMPSLRAHPEVSRMIQETVQATDRHQVTTTEIRLAGGRKLKICGLNDGNVSSLSWRYIWVSEAWQHKSDGLLRKAIRRADRYAHNCKLLIESQAGMAGEDLETESKQAVEVPLTWACPFCEGRQTWECTHEYGVLRPADFVPRQPKVSEELWLPPKPGSYAGMKFPPAEVFRDGKALGLGIDERAAAARWECYHCGMHIPDTPEMRGRIAETYRQEYRADGRSPRAVLFRLPREANATNTFERGVASYLTAKASDNQVLMENWYMSERALFYSPRLGQVRVPVITGSVADPKLTLPGEKFRALLVDCQKDVVESLKQGKDVTGHFWYVAEATDRNGNIHQLARGYATSWDQLFGPGGVKERLRVPTRNVAIDAGNWIDLIAEMAARYRTQEKALDGSGRMVWATWKLMQGDEGRGAKWPDGSWRSYWPPRNLVKEVMDPDGSWLKVTVPVTRWSNFAVKSILYKLRTGAPGQPKFVALHAAQLDALTAARERGDFAYQAQMDGFALGEDANGRPKFIELHKQQHYPDCHCMGIVLRMMAGLVRGEVAAGDADAQESAPAANPPATEG